MINGKNKITEYTFYCIAFIISFMVIAFPPINLFSYDVFGYYMYLPLKFKYNDLTLKDFVIMEDILRTYKPSELLYQAVKWDNGSWVMRYPIGVSVCYAPFYFIGDLIAPFTSYKPDGFSKPYQLSVLYGCLIYTLIGLHFVKKILLSFFSDGVSALTLFFVAIGTNYFLHTSVHGQGAMSHNILFTLYAILIYNTIRWHKDHQFKNMVFMAIAAGLAALCRASEIICVMIPLLYGISSKESLKEKITLLFKHKVQMIWFSCIIMAIGSIQFGYWKASSGHFFINPYGSGNPGEGFELLQPHILEVLFSFRKGLFIYTPLMLFTIFGFWLMYKTNRKLFTPVFLYFILNLYIVSSWSCWWYGSCFGNRALLASYAALVIPLAFAIEYIIKKRSKFIFLPLAFLFTALNLFQSWQMHHGILDTTNMSRAYYFSTFLQAHEPSEAQKDLLLKGKFSTGIDVFTEKDARTHQNTFTKAIDFEKTEINKRFLSDVMHHSGNKSLILCNKTISSCSVQATYNDMTKKSYTWIKASVWVYTFYPIKDPNVILGIHMKHKGYIFKPYEVKLKDAPLKQKEWTKLEYYYLVPDDLRSKKDKVCVFVVNKNDTPLIIDDLSIKSYEPIVDQSYF